VNLIQDFYDEALRSQKSGDLKTAEGLYRRILAQEPRHADALHFLGVIAYQAGRPEEAIRSIAAAIGLNPAKAAYHCNLGLAYQTVRHVEEAANCFEESLRLRPANPVAHNNLGVIRLEQGRPEEAAQCFQQAKRFHANDAEAYCNLGKALRAQGKLDQAIAGLEQAILLRPTYVEARIQLGLVCRDQGDFEQAVQHFQTAIEIAPEHAEAHNNLGASYTKLKRHAEAERVLRRAVELKPDDASVHSNLGVSLLEQGRHEEAKASIEHALRIRPDAAGARSNLGAVCLQQGELDAALEHVEEALRIQPNNIDAHWNRSLIWLSQGRFREGWLEYEWRQLRPESRERRIPRPLWDGSPLEGKKILLHTEQGLGDTIQFCRYARLVAERGGEVLLACQSPLTTLLTRCSEIEAIVPKESGLLQFDLHAPLMSLPGIFRSTEDDIPRSIPYIRPDPDLVAYWHQQLPPSEKLRVGIAWQGNKKFPADHYRSIPLRYFALLAELPGVQLICLQKGEGLEQLQELDVPFGLFVPGELDEANGPFMDTAAIIANLDLVITSDTVIPHLAGAIGTHVWLLLSKSADWRWLLDREDSPWYPTMKIFRQRELNDWDELFHRVVAEMRQRLSES
jgi:tetratricopeptide (TPR) repeat protein